MSPRNMDDYVDVAERIREFKAQYPDGSLQSHEPPRIWQVGDKTYIGYCAAAYRKPDDPRPGIGWAWEPVPGPTPFTRDSELMNAETSAWGRAIVALGFETKKIASANEVRNRPGSSERDDKGGREAPEDLLGADGANREASATRSEGSSGFEAPLPAHERPASDSVRRILKETVETLQKGFPSPDPNHSYWDDVKAYMVSEFDGKTESKALTEAECQQLILEFEKRLVAAQQAEQVQF